MSLPNLPAGDKLRREVRTEWGGINLNENAGDGELIEAFNMSSREYPLLANARITKAAAPEQIIVPYTYNGQLGYTFFLSPDFLLYDPTHPQEHKVLPYEPEQYADMYNLQMAVMGHRMVIAQLKKIYDFDDGTLSDMEASWTSAMAAPAVFMDGELYGVAAEGNTLYADGANWSAKFKIGDAVTISGSRIAAYDKTAVIREISGNYLRFSENTFDVSGRYYLNGAALQQGSVYLFATDAGDHSFTWLGDSVAAGLLLYNEGDESVIVRTGAQSLVSQSLDHPVQTTGNRLFLNKGYCNIYDTVSVSRDVPDMDFICVNENRMWGCKGDTIYASKLGDPLNWNVFDGLSTDSWTAETGTPGNFTGCCSYQGYPTFFKENAVFKVMGDEPGNFILRKVNIQGVKNGSAYSIVEIRSHLYYLSRVGVMQWNGGDYPQIISGALGGEPGQIMNANAGTDGLRYYLSLVMRVYNDNTESYISEYLLLTYDTRYGTWHELTMDYPYGAARFTGDGVNNWMYLPPSPAASPDTGKICTLHDFPTSKDTTTEWRVTFADSTRAYKTALTGSESKKGVLRLLIRCRLAKTMKVWISYDGGDFEEAGEFGGEDGMEKTSRVVPLILRRCDYWQLRLTGVGDAVIYSIAVEKYGGEWQQA